MVLVVIDKLSNLTDFIMWASIAFARQYEVFTTGDYNRDPEVIDLSGVGKLGGLQAGELLYMVGHGDEKGMGMGAKGSYGYEDLGKYLGTHIKAKIVIHCGACFAGKTQPITTGMLDFFYQAITPLISTSGLKKIATGLKAKGKTGIKVKGFRGATVTNFVGGPTAVVSDLTSASNKQDSLVKRLAPQQKLDSWRLSNPNATVNETATASTELNWGNRSRPVGFGLTGEACGGHCRA